MIHRGKLNLHCFPLHLKVIRGPFCKLTHLTCRRISHFQGYIVLNRPWAFVQWLQQADIEEE